MRTAAAALASLAILAVASWHAGGRELFEAITWR
jgi:hypothetical protein